MEKGPTMQVAVNGQERQLVSGTTVADLLRQLDLQPIRVAVEINMNLVTRSTFDNTVISDGDRIEIVTFVGGG